MKLAISNLAWKKEHDEEMLSFLQTTKFSGIECVPEHLPQNFPLSSKEELNKLKLKHREIGLPLISIQSILFNTESLFLFKEEINRERLFQHMMNVIDFTSHLGIKNIVFGSPKNRFISDSISQDEAFDLAYLFFKKLAHYAIEKNTIVSLEPNASDYGANFLTTTKETLDFLEKVNSPGLRLNLDFSTIKLNQSNAREVIQQSFPFINHIHLSEPFLKPLPEDENLHTEIRNTLTELNYDKYVSIEMLYTDVQTAKDKIKFVEGIYQP
jgi:sugar phosphate isomerase/epimerase